MRVGYSATIWDNGSSGIGNYIAEHLRILSGCGGVDLRVIEYGGRIAAAGMPPRPGSSGAGTSRFFQPVSDILWHRFGLKKLAASEGFDLVHVPTVRRLPGRLPCPSVVTVHDLGPVRMRGKYGLLRQFFHGYVTPRLLRSVDAFVTPSRFTRDDLIHFYGVDTAKITVVPNGVDHSLFRPADPEKSRAALRERHRLDAPYFVYISRLEHPAKNHVRLIDAFASFKKKTGLPHQLVLVGAPWNGHEVVMDAARSLADAGQIIIAGHVPRRELPVFLGGATAMIYPSLFEGFGLPVIEAMACGTPVACSRSSSLEEIAEGHGLLFDPENVGQIANALEQLASDESLRARLRAGGLAHAASFTWEKSVEQTIAVWKKTIERFL